MTATVGSLRIDLGINSAQFEAGMRRAQATTQQAARGMQNAIVPATRSMGQMRAGAQQLSFQIGDIAQQFALGQRPMMIFAQQSGQVVQAIGMMRSGAGGFIGFMSGPWGAVLTGAVVLLGTFGAKLFESSNALGDAVRKLRDNAAEAETTRRAQATFGATLEGITDRIRSQTAALQEQNRSLRQNQELALSSARANLTMLEARMSPNLLAQGQAQGEILRLERLAGRNAQGQIIESVELRAARARLAELRAANADLQGRMAEARELIRLSQVPIARREAEALADPLAAIRDRYQGLRDDAEAAAAGNDRLTASLSRTLAAINRQEAAAVTRHQESQRSGRGTTARDLVRPVTGGVMSQFGADRSGVPLNGRLIRGRRHEGVDLRGNLGDPVVAPEGGMARRGNAPGGLGLYVEIRADSGARHLLGHLSGANIPETGQRVTAGQLVGLVGNSGNARGGPPHLHWQQMINGLPVDPMRRVGSSGAAQEANEAAREAAQLAEARAREEAGFRDQLRRLDADLLQIRARQVTTAEEEAQAAVAQLDADRRRDIASYEEDARRSVLDRETTAAHLDALIAARTRKDVAERELIFRRRDERLAEQRYELALSELRDQTQLEQARGALAQTVGERRQSELRLLDMQFEEERLQLAKLRATRRLSPEEEADLARSEASAAQRYTYARQGIERQNRTPLGELLDGLPMSAARANEALEAVAARGLQSLEEGLVGLISGTRSVADAFGDMARSILADLARIQLQRMIIGPLTNALAGMFGGGGMSTGVASGFGGTVAGFLGAPGAWSIGRRAAGGPVVPGRTYVVGERGPELLTMGNNRGVVTPSGEGSSRDGKIVVELRGDIDARIQEGAGIVISRAYPAMKADTIKSVHDMSRRRS